MFSEYATLFNGIQPICNFSHPCGKYRESIQMFAYLLIGNVHDLKIYTKRHNGFCDSIVKSF